MSSSRRSGRGHDKDSRSCLNEACSSDIFMSKLYLGTLFPMVAEELDAGILCVDFLVARKSEIGAFVVSFNCKQRKRVFFQLFSYLAQCGPLLLSEIGLFRILPSP